METKPQALLRKVFARSFRQTKVLPEGIVLIPAADAAPLRVGDVMLLPQGKRFQRVLIESVSASGSSSFQPVGKDHKPLWTRWGTALGWTGSISNPRYAEVDVERKDLPSSDENPLESKKPNQIEPSL